MLEIRELTLPVRHTHDDLVRAAAEAIGTDPEGIRSLTVWKRAIDARKRGRISFNYTVHVDAEAGTAITPNKAHVGTAPARQYRELDEVRKPETSKGSRPIIIGSGPCGLFAGLVLARMGFSPRIFERGKAAGPRARDVTGFWRRGLEFNPESNVQFGEGGAGTFSDGKLYTQTKDRQHRRPWILNELVAAGAPDDILLKARPHIGTDRLIKVVRHLREEIIALGGEVHFESRVDEILLGADRKIRGIRLASGDTVEATQVILAVGHSARETFSMVHAANVFLEPKPFSIGVRIEHPQAMIDSVQYGRFAGMEELGSAPYKFVQHLGARSSAYSFCMCPGGLVVAASSEPGGVVTNGMSSYSRAEANANSG
ncbi:MAG: putative FAD-dependent dehydrogenase, partial [Verrucomicrobiales bacterium]